jgi:hypothetical protein
MRAMLADRAQSRSKHMTDLSNGKLSSPKYATMRDWNHSTHRANRTKGNHGYAAGGKRPQHRTLLGSWFVCSFGRNSRLSMDRLRGGRRQ